MESKTIKDIARAYHYYYRRTNMRPEHPPVLTGKCGKEFARRVAEPLSQKNIELFKEAKKVHEAIKEIK